MVQLNKEQKKIVRDEYDIYKEIRIATRCTEPVAIMLYNSLRFR